MYETFIEKYKNQVINADVYTEIHHITPRYLDGTNAESNLIRLTYRQHILAHLLLYRKYKNIEDLTAYKLMKSMPEERKSIICKMIGERHKKSGHIYELGRKNAKSGWINAIKTTESLRRGGIRAGQIAKESGQIYTIQTTEGFRKGGITQGNIAKESGQIQQLGKYKGLYVLILPDGREFEHAFQAEEATGIPAKTLIHRCKQGNLGYSRRKKTQDELNTRWTRTE